MMRKTIYGLLILLVLGSCRNVKKTEDAMDLNASMYDEPHRPQVHFSPKEKWMNDPNGMVYHKGEYHLFYQYYPDGMVWGPMHWGHAVSKNLIHWTHLPIALYPDSLGLIFSGSAVVDHTNTSGFGTRENPPLVAIFTYHSMEKEKTGAVDYQNQGIAYSIDNGRTWTKYEGNPVLKNQGIKDFRDPKVFWHDETKKWIMILAVSDRVELWGTQDLKAWNKLSDFGYEYGAHGGVWECPDLFPLPVEGENVEKWVMLVSINPGGPNGGSATQYFTGEFDGKVFTPEVDKKQTSWIDYGPDNYAGVTWANVANNRKIFLGWMSNWDYGEAVPTFPWRSAMTLPRDLALKRVNNQLYISSAVVPEISVIASEGKTFETLQVNGTANISEMGAGDVSQSIIRGTFEAKDFSIALSNTLDQKIVIGFDSENNRFFIDRSKSGKTNFSEKYSLQAFAARGSSTEKINITLITDVSSVEVFFDDGISVMTSLFFPDEVFSGLTIHSNSKLTVEHLSVQSLKSIW